MAIELGSIAGPTGTTLNVGGLTGRIKYAPIEYFSAIKTKVDLPDATTNSELVEISEKHTFESGKGFHQIYITRDSATWEGKPNNERDTSGFMTTYKGRTPGLTIEQQAILLQMQNRKLVCLLELADGQWIQSGSERFPAEMKFTSMSGGNEKGYRGVDLEISAFETGMTFYTGTITDYTPVS